MREVACPALRNAAPTSENPYKAKFRLSGFSEVGPETLRRVAVPNSAKNGAPPGCSGDWQNLRGRV
jgi:hypothetical protein